MNEIRCRYCDRYLCSAIAREGKLRITCSRCKRSQVIDLSVKVRAPDHLAAAGL